MQSSSGSGGGLPKAAGDKQSPYFVIPGIGGEVSEWCDCLPEELAAKLER